MTQRTGQQNKGLHKGFELLADTLNDAGLDMKVVLKPEVNIPWTPASVKEYLFRPVMKAMTAKTSTTELEKIGEIEAVWETVMRFLMEKHHIEYLPFPSHELGYADSAPLKDEQN
jgi:hypothetical protein